MIRISASAISSSRNVPAIPATFLPAIHRFPKRSGCVPAEGLSFSMPISSAACLNTSFTPERKMRQFNTLLLAQRKMYCTHLIPTAKVLNAHSLSFGESNLIAILGQCRIDMPVDEHHICDPRIQIATLSLVIRRNVIKRIGLAYKQHVIV